MRKFLVLGLLGAVALLAPAATAQAAFGPVFVSAVGSGPATFTYDLVFSTAANTERLEAGNFVTLYDVEGLIPASVTLTGPFTFTIQNLGINGFLTSPPDSPTIANITTFYTGATIFVDTVFANAVTFQTTVDTTGQGFFSGETVRDIGPNAGQPLGNTGTVTLPRAIPEPASVALMGLGGLGLLGLARLRRKSA